MMAPESMTRARYRGSAEAAAEADVAAEEGASPAPPVPPLTGSTAPPLASLISEPFLGYKVLGDAVPRIAEHLFCVRGRRMMNFDRKLGKCSRALAQSTEQRAEEGRQGNIFFGG